VLHDAVAKVVLAAPKLAAKAAAAATKSQREDAEEAIIQSVQDCLHFLGALKRILPQLTASALLRVCEHLLDLYVLAQPMLSLHGTECLIRAAQGATDAAVPPVKLQQLFKVCALCRVVDTFNKAAMRSACLPTHSAMPCVCLQRATKGCLQAVHVAIKPQLASEKQANVQVAFVQLAEEAVRALQQAGAPAAKAVLADAFAWVAPLLAAESEAVRFAASGALSAMFTRVVTQELVGQCAAQPDGEKGKANTLMRCMAALTSLLGVGYRDAWPHVLRVLGDVFEVLAPAGAPLAEPALVLLANMARCAAGKHGCIRTAS
jgi:hypothetical protein